MKCHQCSHVVKIWQTFCPSCGIRLQSKSFSTINETPIPAEPSRPQRTLRKTLQFALLALAVILLASAVRLGPPQANPLAKEVAKAVAVTTPTPAPTPESEPTPVPTPTPPIIAETKLAPINLLTDVFGLGNTTKPATPKAVKTTTTSHAKPPVASSADEAPAKKLGKSAMMPPPPPTIPDTPPPPPTYTAPEANLEVEVTPTLLQANVGLVSIKSYVPARIYIDGRYSGVTPRSVKLLAGEHSISLMAGGYQEYIRRVKVSGQQQIGILAALSKKP